MIKLLVVDDESGVCDVIQKTFSYIGFSVFTATTAQRALALFEKEKPGIVLLDLLMPDVGGITLLKQFKLKSPSVVVIVVTAVNAEESVLQARAAGADEYVHKPFSHNYLRDIVVDKIRRGLDGASQMQIPRILVVDDEPDLRRSIRAFIEPRFSCQILEAGRSEEALQHVEAEKPDVIFLDIKMPGMSGLDILSEIRKKSPDSRVVIVSAWNSGEVMQKSVGMGAQDYIHKPVALAALGEKLRMILLSQGKLILKKV